MPRPRVTAEQILAKLREAEVTLRNSPWLTSAVRIRRPQGGSNQAAQRPGTGEHPLEAGRRRPFAKECKTLGDVACVNKPLTTWNY